MDNDLLTTAIDRHSVAMFHVYGTLTIFTKNCHVVIDGKEAIERLHRFLGECLAIEVDLGE